MLVLFVPSAPLSFSTSEAWEFSPLYQLPWKLSASAASVRSIIVSDEGYTAISADAARTVAWMSGEVTASLLTVLVVVNEKRSLAKHSSSKHGLLGVLDYLNHWIGASTA